MSEHEEQKALFQWLDTVGVARFPGHCVDGKFMAFAVPNAAKRSPQLASWMRAEGMRGGVPDVFIPIGNDKYNGLFIEMKYGNNKETAAQKKWLCALSDHGYKCITCYNWRTGAEIIDAYLTGKPI